MSSLKRCTLFVALSLAACGVAPQEPEAPPTGQSSEAGLRVTPPTPELAMPTEVALPTRESTVARERLKPATGLLVHADVGVVSIDKKFTFVAGVLGCGFLPLASTRGTGQCYQRTEVDLPVQLGYPMPITVYVVEDTDGDGTCSQSDRAWSFDSQTSVPASGHFTVPTGELKPMNWVPCFALD
ncbi:MAG: hypothetical protein K1X89_18855 [Myxococcaceae bacterium]|nr:hypothetical protein [Myxococcaceae bacterium]